MRRQKKATQLLLLLIFSLIFPNVSLLAKELNLDFPPKPGEREFIADYADLLSEETEKELHTRLDVLLTEKAIPIIVVTIKSIKEYTPIPTRIEMYARYLFDHWGIGHEKIEVKGFGVGNTKEVGWNKGILLLIAVEERKARIELGADYGLTKNDICAQIMQDHIIANFKLEYF